MPIPIQFRQLNTTTKAVDINAILRWKTAAQLGTINLGYLLNTPDVWVNNTANSPQVYDIHGGSPNYTTSGTNNVLNFFAARWLAGTSADTCNCYDCAASVWYDALQAGTAAASVRYSFMEPFGFLALTQLKQRGLCNNPFYGNGGLEIINRTDPSRTSFWNHAFVELNTNGTWYVLDGCAGPHTGGDTVPNYLAAAIDPVHPAGGVNGTIADITYPFTTLNAVTNTAAPFFHENVFALNAAAFVRALGIPLEANRTMDVHPAPWDALRAIPALGPDWKLHYEEIVPGFPETVGYRQYVRGAEVATVQLFVASDDSDTAHRRFVERGSAHEAPGPIFERGPANLGEQSARAVSPAGVRHLWRNGNIVFEVKTPAAIADAVVRSVAESAARARAAAPQPPPVAPSASRSEANVGETVTVGVSAAHDHVLAVAGAHEGLTLVGHSANQLVFHAQRAADDHLVVVSVDPRTLLSSAAAMRVLVRP